jgi:hypothetical protein
MKGRQPNFWMAVESLHNWRADERNGFRFLGVSEFAVDRAKQVQRGDCVFVYVSSPRSAFSDVRLVIEDGLHRSPHVTAYDVPCYAGLTTAPLVVLEREQWLPIRTIINGLSCVQFKAGWGNALRRSFRSIRSADAQTILCGMERLSPSLPWNKTRTMLKLDRPKTEQQT